MPRARPSTQLPRFELFKAVLLQTAPPGALGGGFDYLSAGLFAEGAVDPALGLLATGQVESRYCSFFGGDAGDVVLLGVEDDEVVKRLDVGLLLGLVLGMEVVYARNLLKRRLRTSCLAGHFVPPLSGCAKVLFNDSLSVPAKLLLVEGCEIDDHID